MRQSVRNVLACGLVFLAVTAAARPLPAATSGRTPVPSLGESIDVRVVNLETVVTDHGAPVHGLAREDFRLLVNGEERPIEYFSEIHGGVTASGGGGLQASARGIPELSPGKAVGTSYLVFVDDYFSLAEDRDRVLNAALDQVDRLRPEDRMAVVAYDGNHLEMLASWSRPGPFLERALLKAQRRPALGLQRWSERRSYEVAAWLPEGLKFRRSRSLPAGAGGQLNPDEYFYARLLEDQVEREVMAVSATLRGFAAAPGRRVAILLSGGWPYDIPAYVTDQIARPSVEPGFLTPSELYRPLVETANLLGYTLYSVDVPGTQGSALEDARGGLAGVESPRLTSYEHEAQYHLALDHVARQTGGKAILNSWRSELLNATADDTDSYYWLGFTPSRSGDDSRWKVEVEVTRPGVRVRTRRSFTDLSHQREINMAVESALVFGNPPSPRPLIAHLSEGRSVGMHKMSVPLSVRVPSDAVSMVPEGDHYVANLELRVAALGRDGTFSEAPAIPLTLSASSRSPAPGLVYETELELRRKTEKLVVSLYDKTSGTILLSSLKVAL